MDRELLGVLLFLTILVSMITPSIAHCDTRVHLSETRRVTIVNTVFPIPLVGNYTLRVDMIITSTIDVTISHTVDKYVAEEGDQIILSIAPSKSALTIETKYHVMLLDPKGKIAIDTVIPGAPLSIEAPARQDIDIPLPALPFAIIGIPIPAELSLILGITIEAYPKTVLTCEGLIPKTVTLIFRKLETKTVRLVKTGELGGEVRIAAVGLESNLIVEPSIGVTVTTIKTPLKFKVRETKTPIIKELKPVGKTIAIIKTPISITLEGVGGEVEVEKEVTIVGYVKPPHPGLEVKVLIKKEGEAWKTLTITKTSSTGEIRVKWIPKEPGKYKIKLVHEETKYTTHAESNTIEVKVKEKPSPLQMITQYMTSRLVTIALVLTILILVIIIIILLRRK